MPVSVVVGGQFGSEGKGKVAHWLAKTENASIVVRVGGSNSGHTAVDDQGNARVFRHLPTACPLPNPTLVIGPGSYIDVPVLLNEIDDVGLDQSRLRINPRAVVISEAHKRAERDWGLQSQIGSTGSGTGAAVVERARRAGQVCLASDDERLQPFLDDTTAQMRDALEKGARIIIEGTQGFGLSLLHSPHYPFATSRDTSAAGFVSEAGLSPLDVNQVIMVIRAFPIRVSGQSGPLPNETTWEAIAADSGNQPLEEHTTVTQKLRRVAKFDPEIVCAAIRVNRPTSIVLNHLDHLDPNCRDGRKLSFPAEQFRCKIEGQLGSSIEYVGCGPDHVMGVSRELPLAISN